MIGVREKYRGLPQGYSYAKRILDDLHAEAQRDAATRPFLVLCVHPNNTRAIAFYRRKGFAEVEPPTTKSGYLRMAIAIAPASGT